MQSQNNFKGNWNSTRNDKEFVIILTRKDTVLPKIDIEPENIFGGYRYGYGEEGYQGDFEIKKLKNNKAEFKIFSVTKSPSRNMAEVELDTITLANNSFKYTIPEADECEFKVDFYKDFIFIEYTNGNCNLLFGLNATIEGIFYKTIE